MAHQPEKPNRETQSERKERLPQGFRVQIVDLTEKFLEAIKAGVPIVLGDEYYDDQSPLTRMKAELIPGVGEFQVTVSINNLFARRSSINVNKLINTLSSFYKLEVQDGFAVFASQGGIKFALEPTRFQGFRIVAIGTSNVPTIHKTLHHLAAFVQDVVTHAYINQDLTPPEAIFQIKLPAPNQNQKVATGPKRAKKPESEAKPKVEEPEIIGGGRTFADIVGNQEIKDDFLVLVRAIKDPVLRKKVGYKIPKGLLLEGPPGTGKSLMAEATANEAKCRFVEIIAADIFTKYVGEAEQALKEVFEEARKQSPGVFTIIFFDDFDLFLGSRDDRMHEVGQRVMQVMLVYLDGLKKSDNLMVLAATNKPDQIDSAMRRPGRFDERVSFGLPSRNDRKALFSFYFARVEAEEGAKVFDQLNWKELLDISEGMSQAGIAVAVEAAKRQASKKAMLGGGNDRDLVTQAMMLKHLQGEKAHPTETKKGPLGFQIASETMTVTKPKQRSHR